MHISLIGITVIVLLIHGVYSANSEATNKEYITGYKEHVYNEIDHPEDMDEKDKVKPKSMASSTAYHNFLQSVNDNDHASIKSDDVSCIQSVKENGEHYNKPKSLPKPRYSDVATPITDAQSTHKAALFDDSECAIQHPTTNDSALVRSCAINNKENIAQDITHTTNNGSMEGNDHEEIVCHSPAHDNT